MPSGSGLCLTHEAPNGGVELEEKMNAATKELLGNMVDKYIELFIRAIEAGATEQQAHEAVTEFFVKGFSA